MLRGVLVPVLLDALEVGGAVVTPIQHGDDDHGGRARGDAIAAAKEVGDGEEEGGERAHAQHDGLDSAPAKHWDASRARRIGPGRRRFPRGHSQVHDGGEMDGGLWRAPQTRRRARERPD